MATLGFPLAALFNRTNWVASLAGPTAVWVVFAAFGQPKTSDDDMSVGRVWKIAVACTIACAAVAAATTVLAVARLQHAPLLAGLLLSDAAVITAVCVWFYGRARRYRARHLQTA